MKNAFLMAMAAVFLAGSWAGAGPRRAGMGNEERAQKLVVRRAKRLSKRLALNADQAGKLEAILKKRAEERKAIVEEFAKKMDAFRAGTSEQIEGLLTNEQKEKFAKLEADVKERRDERREARHGMEKD